MPPHLGQALPRMNIPIFGPLPEIVLVSFSYQREAGDPHILDIFSQLAESAGTPYTEYI
ncbi:MAG: hypothetical protein PVI73_14190 [Syntrophobacterales bacterium]|jgi:hypothetical protein